METIHGLFPVQLKLSSHTNWYGGAGYDMVLHSVHLSLWRTAAPTSPELETVAVSSVSSLLGKVVRRL